ncbi:MAG: uracil-DNA glycosylase [Proteobacteria bacterium]|nr:uracil-DNA glycosylase [Pseudomonadota bacterium]
MTIDKNQFLTGLKSLLRYHQASGIDSYPKGADSEAFLGFQPVPSLSSRSVVEAGKVNRRQEKDGRSSGTSPEKSPLRLTDIADEIAACHACDLHKQRLYPVAGRGPEKVRLLLVGDWLASDEQGQLPHGQLFGVEQDLMLARMLAAIQLPVGSVFITNVIKCAVPANCQPQANHVESCVSFLRRQITVLLPEIICTMGMVAARAVLEKSLPLSRLRGRFHEYQVSGDVKIPVVTTYHPTYLLQNSEMKAATWADLQLLAKELQ